MNKIIFAVIILLNTVGGITMYQKIGWENSPSIKTPVSAENLEHMDEGIYQAHSQLAEAMQRAVSVVSHNVDKNIIVSFMDDDGHERVMSILKPIFDAEGVPAISAINTGRISETMTMSVADWHILKDSGWSVVSHAHQHLNLNTLSESECEYQIKTAKDILNQEGLDGDIIAYPYGANNELVRQVVRRHSVLGMGTLKDYNKMPLNTFSLFRFSGIGTDGVTLQACKDIVDNAPNNSWIIFFSHVGGESYLQQTTIDDYHALIQYVKSQNIDIVNAREGLERKGNIIDVGNDSEFFKLGRDGSLLSNPTNNLNFDVNTDIFSFPLGESRYYLDYTQSVAKDFPGRASGTLTVYRVPYSTLVGKEAASYQTYKRASNDDVYSRRWIALTATTGSWDEWVRTISVPNSTSVSLTMDIFYQEIQDTKIINFLYVEKIFSVGGTQPTLTKEVWQLSELSRDSSTPTVLATIGAIDLVGYVTDKGVLAVKNSATGAKYTMFFKVSFC